MSKRILYLVAFCFLMNSFIVFAQRTPINQKTDIGVNEFRGIKWGTNIEDLYDLEYLKTCFCENDDIKIKIYTIENENLNIGRAKVSSIKYGFWNKELSVIIIRTEDLENWYKLRNEVNKRLKSFKMHEERETYAWFNQIQKTVLLFYFPSRNNFFKKITSG